jgi:energy-coupling factor transporter ATP-binding protein EcfA2
MTFPFEVTINLAHSKIAGITNPVIKVFSGITVFLGPNGSGKTVLLRGLKTSLSQHLGGKRVRYVSAGRLGVMEHFRSDYDGHRGGAIRFDDAELGNKGSLSARHNNETVTGDFATLSERPDILIKVRERLQKLFNRNVVIDWDHGNLKVYFSKVGAFGNYSSAREASGLLHMVAILASLYDDEVGCLLIDEPEVSLHPQLQSFLLTEINAVAGPIGDKGKKLIFLSTHSTEFIDPRSVDQLASIVFCTDPMTAPTQIDPAVDEFRSQKLQGLLARISQEHKLAFFSHVPLLVEGPSDSILCSAISRKLSLHLEAAGCQIVPIIGKGQFPTVVKLMRLIGKKPVVLADADAIADGLDVISSFISLPHAEAAATKAGHKDGAKFARDVYNDFSQLVSKDWGNLERFCAAHPYWSNRESGSDTLAQRRASFCWLVSAAEADIKQPTNGTEWVMMRTRLIALLDFLENLGCFVLRKGTIESYYRHAGPPTKGEKPSAAVSETMAIQSEAVQLVESDYGDIIRPLRYCAKTRRINEAEAVRDLLLATVTPLLASATPETTNQQLAATVTALLGTKAQLFKVSLEHERSNVSLKVDLLSDILDIQGFPIIITKGTNPIDVVNQALKLT